MPSVVNVTGLKGDARQGILYCGRLWAGWPASALGNPFRLKNVPDRRAALACYRSWLERKIRARDPAVLAALAEIQEDSVLGCWCFPKSCHADVIIEVWRKWKDGFYGQAQARLESRADPVSTGEDR